MGQHNNFGKDMDLIAEAYGTMLGGAHIMQSMGVADQAADHMRDEDGEDKTGGMSDEALLASVEKKGTAGDVLLRAAHERISKGESLTPHERDALARDQYEDQEDTDVSDAGPEAWRRKSEDATAAEQGFSGRPATPAR
jgi:hypothetical protein